VRWQPGGYHRQQDYDIEAYPVTLDVLKNTRCIGNSGTSGPNDFRNRQTVEECVRAFHKVWENLDPIAAYALKLDYQPPWANSALSTRGQWTVLSPKRTSQD